MAEENVRSISKEELVELVKSGEVRLVDREGLTALVRVGIENAFAVEGFSKDVNKRIYNSVLSEISKQVSIIKTIHEKRITKEYSPVLEEMKKFINESLFEFSLLREMMSPLIELKNAEEFITKFREQHSKLVREADELSTRLSKARGLLNTLQDLLAVSDEDRTDYED